MKKRIKIKLVPLLVMIFVLVPLLAITIISNNNMSKENNNTDYINEDTVSEESLPVVKTTKMYIKPFVDQNVKVGKSYYDYKGEEESQKNSIIVHEDTYIQNSGIDYINESTFDVIAIMDGTVINVKEDEELGKIVEIKHENGCVSIYQSLSEVSVKKGDELEQGHVLGKSGTNKLDEELGNHLHFEMYDNGQLVNPDNYFEKEVQEKE